MCHLYGAAALEGTDIVKVIAPLIIALLFFPFWAFGAEKEGTSDGIRWKILADGFNHPWSLAFLPNGNILITEREGRLRIVRQGTLDPIPVEGMPRIVAYGQGGLLDVVLHPDYQKNRWVYLAYVSDGLGGQGTEVVRARFDGFRLTGHQRIFRALPKSQGGRHFGARMVFDKEGYLYISLGDRGKKDQSQYLDTHPGSVVRLMANGAIPTDNPFVVGGGARPEIFTWGHRNPQGMIVHPETGEVWVHEHGPRGGDEVNILRSGANYGWPIVTHGRAYSGLPIGEGKEKEGMEPPIHVWVPSIAPSGMAFYTGEDFPAWKGSLLIGALKDRMLVRLRLEGADVVKEERLLEGVLGRIRDVRQGPDGLVYLLTDHRNGALIQLAPSGGR